MLMRYASLSKQGARRNNEDYIQAIYHPEENSWMGIICDGMGGHSKGELASQTVAETITRYWQKHLNYKDDQIKVEKACLAAYRRFSQKAENIGNMEMGTTMVMVSIQNTHLTIAHVGDSRCYHFRKKEGCIFQTQDHVKNSSGWEIVARCFFTGRPDVAIPEIHKATLQRGDKILLCSDGLYTSMPTDILKEKVMEEKLPAEILDEFDFLCEENGDDNYSGILLEILEI